MSKCISMLVLFESGIHDLKSNPFAKLNQMITSIISEPKSKNASDACFYLADNFWIETTQYVNDDFWGYLFFIFNSTIEILYFKFHCIRYWGLDLDNCDFEVLDIT